MGKVKSFFAGLLVLGFLTGCSDCDDNVPSDTASDFSQNFGSQVSRDFIGQVVDMNQNPIQNAEVKIGNSTARTDSNGVFMINGASVYKQFAYIIVKKAGYIDGSRALVPTSGKNNVKIMMIPNTPVENIQSGVPSEVILPNGTKVNFDGAFKDENGNAYSGSVQVSVFHLEPTNENLNSLMPGMLYAEDRSGNEKILETFGMMNVELRGSGGQALQLESGHTAQITMPIADSQLGTAPNTIPLWHFDELNGYWREGGSATRVGNNYVGKVSHFSWWNCDAQFPTISLTVNIVDQNGNPLSNVSVQIIRTANNIGTHGITDEAGQVSGLVPSNEVLTLQVNDLCGGSVIYSSSMGPFSADTVLPTITISSSILTSEVIGNLLKCDGTDVSNGYVMLIRDGHSPMVASVSNGDFSFHTLYCDNDTSFQLKGVDYDNLQETDVINYNFVTPTTTIGNLSACNTISEFISYQIDNGDVLLLIENLQGGLGPNAQPNYLQVSGTNQNQFGLYIWGNSNTPGTYTTSVYSIEGSLVGFIGNGTPNTISFNLSHFGAIGEYIDMTFNGTYSDTTGTHTINGVVHVVRDN